MILTRPDDTYQEIQLPNHHQVNIAGEQPLRADQPTSSAPSRTEARALTI